MSIRTIDIVEATKPLAEYARNADSESVVITANGKPIAVVLPIENADAETVALSENPGFLALIERSRARQKREGGLSSEQVRRRFGLSKVRKTNRN